MTIAYYSTNGCTKASSFKQVLIQGLAQDNGLFLPSEFPKLSQEEIARMKKMPFWEIAFTVLSKYLEKEIPASVLKKICRSAYNFSIPLEKIEKNVFVMRLDQGPTASFKDFAARFMARLMQYYLKKEKKQLTILTATSGDTGGAVAAAFYGLKNIKVIVLFPEKEVSERQRRQMTTLGKNIRAVSVKGKFDDCQAIVKKAFADTELKSLNLSSANSINLGRLLPQTCYYFYAFSRLCKKNEKIVFSVPCGNFGNIVACFIAKQMGLPIKKLIAAVNENNEFEKFLETGKYEKISPSRNCLSNAMNVGHPSNLARLITLYNGQMDENGTIKKMPDMQSLKNDFFTVSVSDNETKKTIATAFRKKNLLLEPHGAVAWNALQRFLKENQEKSVCVSLETAHPAKFPEEIKELLNLKPKLPKSMRELDKKKEKIERINANIEEFKNKILLQK